MCRGRLVCGSNGMLQTGETRSTSRKTCSSGTLSTTNLTWTDLRSKQGFSCDRPATNRLSHCKAIKHKTAFHLHCICTRIQLLPHRERSQCHLDKSVNAVEGINRYLLCESYRIYNYVWANCQEFPDTTLGTYRYRCAKNGQQAKCILASATVPAAQV
jgi:hypothetical protein